MIRAALRPILFPYTTLFRSGMGMMGQGMGMGMQMGMMGMGMGMQPGMGMGMGMMGMGMPIPIPGCIRSEEHTSELQSLTNLVCRLLLEKKKTQHYGHRVNYT